MKAVYAGSFDPFTKGHMDSIKEALNIFTSIDIVIAVNSNKNRRVPSYRMKLAIEHCLKDFNVKVVIYDGLVAEYCKQEKINYLVRGLRDVSDYLYEEKIAKVNEEIYPNLRTVYLRSEDGKISSSMIWELYQNGYDIDKYIPYPVEFLKL